MSSDGYTAEVIGLSPNATEKDVYDFFTFCGAIQHVEIIRAGGYACTAYVTFKNYNSLETAVLLSGSTIVDQPVCITKWGHYDEDAALWNQTSWNLENQSSPSHSHEHLFVSSAGEAVTITQDIVKTMIAKGYVLGKDALGRAKAFDESRQLSATATAKVAELSDRIGLTDKIFAGVEAARSVDQRYGVLDNTKSAMSATGRTAAAAANAVVSSSYFAKGALWVSGALNRAAQVAADLGNRHNSK